MQLQNTRKLYRLHQITFRHLNFPASERQNVVLHLLHENYLPFVPEMNPNLQDSRHMSIAMDPLTAISRLQRPQRVLLLARHLLNSCVPLSVHGTILAKVHPRCVSTIIIPLSALILRELSQPHSSFKAYQRHTSRYSG